METLQWNEVLATGIREIDEQHKCLLDILNQLREAIERGEHKTANVALKQMRDYASYHFNFEEKLLEKAGYGMLPLHRRVHELFVARVQQFQQRYAAGEDILRELHNMLARWLVNHIQNEDRNYATTVKAYLRREKRKRRKAREQHTGQAPQPADASTHKAAGQADKRSLWGRLSDFMSGEF